MVSYYDNLEFLKDIIPEKVITKEAIEKRKRLIEHGTIQNTIQSTDLEALNSESGSEVSDEERADLSEKPHPIPSTQ